MNTITIGNNDILIDKKTNKVRLINLVENKLLVCIYDGCYMLPGGKIDENETTTIALKREILEETGNQLSSANITYFINVLNYLENYNSRYSTKPINKLVNTAYYTYDLPLDLTVEKKLSELEKNNNVYFQYIELYKLIDILTNNINYNEKQKVYAEELLLVIKSLLNNKKLIDLHTHSIYSDGELEPNALIDEARKNNISTIAITDHDTVLGLDKIDYQKYNDISIIPGIELSIKRPFGRMHILGLDIDYKNEKLINELKIIKDNNNQNLRNIVNYLINNGIIFNEQDIKNIFNRIGNIGRPDIAKLLIKEGYVKSVQEAFDKYLIEAFNKTRKQSKSLTYDEAIKLILEANGIPILAHPNSLELNNEDFENLLIDLIKSGLMGIEIYHPHMTETERDFYRSMVDKYNLLYSAGSDFHGKTIKPDIKIGNGKNNIFCVTAPILKKIKTHK